MSPAAKEPDQSTYSGRFAARLRMLREKAGLSVQDVISGVNHGGFPLKQTAYYNWESGRNEPPLNAYPVVASVLKVKPRSLLPTE